MDQSQRELRHSAAAAFLESLEQLEQQLQSAELQAEADEQAIGADADGAVDVDALADAAADIERFILAQRQQGQA